MRRLALLALCLWVLLPATAAPTAPTWLTDAARAPAKDYGPKTRYVVLLDEVQITVTGKGTKQRKARYAIRIVSGEGTRYAAASIAYLVQGGKVKSLKAWLITPSGNVKEYGNKEVSDGAYTGDVYNEYRVKSIDARGDAVPGAVFGWEGEEEDRSIFTQEQWFFQGAEPVVLSRYVLQLPPGWKAEGRIFHHAPFEPVVQGDRYTWELGNLPKIERQESGPFVSSLAPYLAVNYYPPAGTLADAPVFTSWKDLSVWKSSLREERSTANDAIRAKVTELTAGAGTPMEKIDALGRYVQGIRYVSIQVGLARGGGYQPHAASEVFAKGYGDCKDKANLLVTMLREAGIQGHAVSIASGNPRRVKPEWPSPHQFNHAIVAIQVPADVDAPAAAEYEGFGRLLFFDPTDDDTPLGILPDHEQDSYVLLDAGERGTLVKTPKAPPESNHVERRIEAELRDDQGISARIIEVAKGDPATTRRRVRKQLSPPDYRKRVDRWLGVRIPGSTIKNVEVDSDWPHFERHVELDAPVYGQVMGGRLWIFKPSLLDREDTYTLRDEERTQPFLVDASSFREEVRITLPASFEVDEIPDEISVENDFGAFHASWQHEENQLRFVQSLRVAAAEVPAERYEELRDFLLTAQGAAELSVVLVKR